MGNTKSTNQKLANTNKFVYSKEQNQTQKSSNRDINNNPQKKVLDLQQISKELDVNYLEIYNSQQNKLLFIRMNKDEIEYFACVRQKIFKEQDDEKFQEAQEFYNNRTSMYLQNLLNVKIGNNDEKLQQLNFQYHGIDLNQVLQNFQGSHLKSKIYLKFVLKISYQILKAIEFLHSNDVIHKNICLDSFLLDTQGYLKVTNISCYIASSDQQKFKQVMHQYKPPEHEDDVTLWYDIWSFGCVMYYLYTKKFLNTQIIEIKKAAGQSCLIKDFTQKEVNSFLNNLKKSKLKNILSLILKVNYKERPNASDLLQHKIFRKIRNTQTVNTNIIQEQQKNQFQYFNQQDTL